MADSQSNGSSRKRRELALIEIESRPRVLRADHYTRHAGERRATTAWGRGAGGRTVSASRGRTLATGIECKR